ncbi:MAG: glycosyltransferase [Bacteroidia bacterium]|nr:glycosyltransferase [Bacteroidia bacterium]
MSILIITIHADPTIHPGAQEGGGSHLYINELINLLIYRNVPALFITRKASPGADFFEYGPVKLCRIKIGPESQWDKRNLMGLEEEINAQIEDAIKAHQFRPTFIHSIYWCSGRAALMFSDNFKIPFVHTIISNGLRKRKTGYQVSDEQIAIEQKIYENAEVLIAISNQEKNDLEELYKVSSEKIKVIGRGVDSIFLSDLYDNQGTLLSRTQPKVERDGIQ